MRTPIAPRRRWFAWVGLCFAAGVAADWFEPGWRGLVLAVIIGGFMVAAKYVGAWVDGH